ncbi:hypothetical protein [Streptomyces virginiae]|uniref:hypothetical protein n=1 Tax=Streptomyces virginiae TaxID=1961 RepID=UPI002DD8F5C8|nr:hypothetical protein [Streptomyces virginiae]WSC76872.1 hypothetical protein OHA56_11315 [Streptomyces virginiae]
MMHGTIPAQRVSSSPTAARTDLFGDPDPREDVRVPIQLTTCVSFAEIVGLLTYSGGLDITYADLDDDAFLRETLIFALVMSDHIAIEHGAARAAAVLDDGNGTADEFEFVTCLAAAVTRVFGVTA